MRSRFERVYSTPVVRVVLTFVPFRTAVACVCAAQTVGDGAIAPTRNGSNGPRARFQCRLALSETLVPAAGLYAVPPRITISCADFQVTMKLTGINVFNRDSVSSSTSK